MNINLSSLFPSKFSMLYNDRPLELFSLTGRAAGKTKAFSRECILTLLSNPDTDAIIVRKHHNSLDKSVVMEIEEALESYGLLGYWTYRKQDKLFTNGKQNIYFSGSEPERIKAIKPKNKISYFWLEELQQFQSRAEVLQIKATFTRTMINECLVRYSGNYPLVLTNWVYEFEDAMVRSGVTSLKCSYKDIAYLLPERMLQDIQNEKRIDKKTYEYIYHGITSGFNGVVFDNLEPHNFIKDKPTGYDRLLIGIDDGNTEDEFACMVIVGKIGKDYYVVSETVVKDSSPNEIAREFKETLQRYQNYTQHIYVDSAARGLLKTLREHDLFVQPCVKGAGSVEDGIKLLRGLIGDNTLHISDDLVTLKEEFGLYCRDANGKLVDKHNHLIDALRYALYSPISKGLIKING